MKKINCQSSTHTNTSNHNAQSQRYKELWLKANDFLQNHTEKTLEKDGWLTARQIAMIWGASQSTAARRLKDYPEFFDRLDFNGKMVYYRLRVDNENKFNQLMQCTERLQSTTKNGDLLLIGDGKSSMGSAITAIKKYKLESQKTKKNSSTRLSMNVSTPSLRGGAKRK